MRDRAALDKARARQEENIGKADEILALLKDEGGKDSGLGETSEISLIKKYETPISKDFVSADEYKDYQSMYDHFDTIDIPQTYKEGLINSYENMDGNLKRTYNEFAAKLNIADSEYDGIARFDSISGDIKLDWKQDIDNPLGFGNTYFHETGHAIDYYKGLSPKGVGLSAQAGFTALAQQDFNGSIARVTRQYAFTNVEAQSIISADLMRNPNASNCVSDVFGGLTGNKVRGVWGHNNKYWSDRGGAASPIIGQEAFAEINADVCVNNADSLSYINKYLPKTKAMYDKIMGGA
jgi:hypothetical protein